MVFIQHSFLPVYPHTLPITAYHITNQNGMSQQYKGLQVTHVTLETT